MKKKDAGKGGLDYAIQTLFAGIVVSYINLVLVDLVTREAVQQNVTLKFHSNNIWLLLGHLMRQKK